MCIVIDINCLTNVFKTTSANHSEFKPVYDWIMNGRGTVVFGGGNFIQELRKTPFLPFFNYLKDIGKAKRIDPQEEIDKKELEVKQYINDKDFDDPHLVALLIVSGCKLICSADERAYKYFQHNDFFKPSSKRPKIYNGKSSKSILANKNIANVCLPCILLTKVQRKIILSIKP